MNAFSVSIKGVITGLQIFQNVHFGAHIQIGESRIYADRRLSPSVEGRKVLNAEVHTTLGGKLFLRGVHSNALPTQKLLVQVTSQSAFKAGGKGEIAIVDGEPSLILSSSVKQESSDKKVSTFQTELWVLAPGDELEVETQDGKVFWIKNVEGKLVHETMLARQLKEKATRA